MKKSIFSILLIILSLFTLCSCGEIEQQPVTPPNDIIDNDINNNNNNNNTNVNTTPVGSVEYVVSLVYNKKLYIPKEGETITVVWSDGYAQYSEVIGSDGYAKKKLDGEFNVYLEETLTDYTYNPNIYTADNENPVVEIELLKISKVSKGSGTGLYNEYELTATGTYRSKLTTNKKQIYYEYQPKEAGWYVIESLVNVYDDLVNPKLDIYEGTFAYKNYSETKDSGGAYIKGGYTKNFKWVVNISEQRIGNVFTFVVYADTKTGLYPVTIDFSITYEGEYYEDGVVSKVMVAEEANFKTPEFDLSKYTYYNSNHGTGSYYNGSATATGGNSILYGSEFKYNEETGYWHLYDYENNTFGPILCAKISQPCAYYEAPLDKIEYAGNKNLTVSNSAENYKQFIEVDYAAACNSDGVCYVTQELMEFLQKFSVSQRLFFDGNGFVESTGVFALEDDQWLFACGYYKENGKE